MPAEICVSGLCASPYWLAAAIVILVGAYILWRFTETERGQIWSSTKQIGSAIKEVFQAIAGVFRAFWRLGCWVYIIPWRVWWRTRLFLVQAIIAFITLVSTLVVLESLLILIHHNKEIVEQLGPKAGEFVETLGILPNLPFGVDLFAFILAVGLVWHHINEWLTARRNAELPEVLGSLTRDMWNKPAFTTLTPSQKQERFDRVMTAFRAALEHKRPRFKISVSLWVPDAADILSVSMIHMADNGPPFDQTVRLKKGEGCAGLAFQEAQEMYAPAVNRFIVINVRTGKPAGEFLRDRSKGKEPFKSVYCAPIADVAQTRVVGVLTFAARKNSGFGPADHEILRLAGVYASLLLF
jgi:hypothetical protein